jgi:hypothetical protein
VLAFSSFKLSPEFRVKCSGYKRDRERRKRHKQLFWFLPQSGSSPAPLALPRRFFTIITQYYNCSSTQARDFKYSSTQARDFLCSSTKARDFIDKQITKNKFG